MRISCCLSPVFWLSYFPFVCSLGTGKETEETNLLQQLSDACLVVDALEPSVREDLVKNFCSRELTSYRQIFEGAGQSDLNIRLLHNSTNWKSFRVVKFFLEVIKITIIQN